MEKHPLHLKTPELHSSPEVERAVKRKEDRAKHKNEVLREDGQKGPLLREKIPNDPAKRIDAYMSRLENVFLNPDERKRERNLEMFRGKIYDALIIKRDNFPESYFELQKRVARERGQAVEEIPESVREQMKDVAIEDQKASLDAWMEYLTSNDAVYPAWFKYFVWRNVTKLSQFDKERGEFKDRTLPYQLDRNGNFRLDKEGNKIPNQSPTVAPYPDIYREPLAQIADIYEKVKADNKTLKEPEIKEAFSKKFPSLYAELIQKSLAATIENKEEIKGTWIKYEQGRDGDAEKLFKSLEGKGTGWCTAGYSTSKAQIESGDFYVYYTNDPNGEPSQPRLAIRMDGNDKIGEVRGILPHQGVEPMMQEVLDGKLKDFGSEADAYRKKSADMKQFTVIDEKSKAGTALSKDDLLFLYEANGKIEGFGYARDPRIDELRRQRDKRADLAIIFDCTEEELERKEHFTLRDIPTFSKLPAENAIKKDFKFDWIWEEEYRKDRPVTDFALTEADLAKIDLDKESRTFILDAIKAGGSREKQTSKESLSEAKVFDIGDAIQKKKQADPRHPDYLTTKEVFEAIDEAGYRPATIEDLLAYGRDHWKPDADPITLTDEEKLLQRVNAPYIHALGSPFTLSGGSRYVPDLIWYGDGRRLDAYDLVYDWRSDGRFLVLRK